MKQAAYVVTPANKGRRIPSKDAIQCQQELVSESLSLQKIPKEVSCMTENTENACLASKYVKKLQKVHKKLSYASEHCRSCKKPKTIKRIDKRKIVNKQRYKILSGKLCILGAHNRCPRVKQMNTWIINCKLKLNSMRNCSAHSSMLRDEKKNLNVKIDIITLILND